MSVRRDGTLGSKCLQYTLGIATDCGVLFRLFGPEKPLFDKTWVLPDIEKTQ
jgi:hypothetical protein